MAAYIILYKHSCVSPQAPVGIGRSFAAYVRAILPSGTGRLTHRVLAVLAVLAVLEGVRLAHAGAHHHAVVQHIHGRSLGTEEKVSGPAPWSLQHARQLVYQIIRRLIYRQKNQSPALVSPG